MSALLQLQKALQEHVMTGDLAIQSSIATQAFDAEDAPLVRLHIYRNAYEARLIEALASNYPCLEATMGVEGFSEMALSYIHSCPSSYRSIRWFGDRLPDFLEGHLKELAEFEWKMTLAFDARDAACIDVNDMAEIPVDCWAEMRLLLHPSVQRSNLSWNVVAIWEAIMNEESIPEACKNYVIESWVLWREDGLNRFCPLNEDEAWGLDAAQSGMPFGDICEGLCQWHKEEAVGLVAAGFLKGWVELGLIHQVIT